MRAHLKLESITLLVSCWEGWESMHCVTMMVTKGVFQSNHLFLRKSKKVKAINDKWFPVTTHHKWSPCAQREQRELRRTVQLFQWSYSTFAIRERHTTLFFFFSLVDRACAYSLDIWWSHPSFSKIFANIFWSLLMGFHFIGFGFIAYF